MIPLPRSAPSRCGLAAAMVWLGLAAAALAAEPQPPGAAPADPSYRGEATPIPANGRPIRLEVGNGILIRLPRAASTVFVASPDIADVQVKSPTLIYVSAKSPGATVIYAVDANDQVLLNAPVRVDLDLSQLRQSLRQLVPGAPISFTQLDSNLVLSGTVASAGQAEKVRSLANAAVAGVKGGKIINRLTVAIPNQVSLHVTIAEVDRSILKTIGINWSKLGTSLRFMTNNVPTLPSGAVPSYISVGKLTGEAVSATVQALATEGFLTVLAAPNLAAVSGQTANFLAGGEFPIPVPQSGSVGTAVAITIEFKQYGVQLAFTPTIIDADHLNLRVRPEVSQLDYAHAVQEQGFLIPALTEDSAETTVELASGQSFALAGLLQHNTAQDLSKVPWLGDIPILGALFRSNEFQHNETELVVIVTPYLVEPTSATLASPLDGWVAPHDAQQVLWGDTWRQSLPGPARGPLNSGGSGLIGPAGFRLD